MLFRPGFLTAEYLSGRRQPYAPPLRAYVFASAVFFGLVALLGTPVIQVYFGSPDPTAEAQATALVNAAFAYVHFFLVPLLAVFLMALFRRPRRYFVEHLVFALYFGTSVFLLVTLFGTLARVLGAPSRMPQGAPTQALGIVMVTALFAHLVLALHRAYGRSWPGTILRGVALTLLYLLLFGIIIGVLILLAYRFV